VSKFNLFESTRKLTDKREDHLTEFLVAALDVDPDFRAAYCQILLAEYARKQQWDSPVITGWETQVEYPGIHEFPGSRVDLRLMLEDGHIILVEHKLRAPETKTQGAETSGKGSQEGTLEASEEKEDIGQLKKYLALDGVDGVAYVRERHKSPSEVVLENPKYIRPTSRSHFLWRDLYPALLKGQHEVTRWLREGFEEQGYTPPHPELGDLNRQSASLDAQKNFAKLWDGTKETAEGLGWRVETGSICELYLYPKPSSAASWVFITPYEKHGTSLKVSVTLREPAAAESLCADYQERLSRGGVDVTAAVIKEKPVFTTSWRTMLEGLDVNDMDARLLNFVLPVLEGLAG
jgi:hypothetical protein